VSATAATLVDDIVALACIPAPTFSEEARIEWIEERLAGAPGERRRDGAGNLLWTWGAGAPELLLTAHADTVFGPEVPLAVRNDGRSLHGPGVGDNAAAIAVAIHVLEDLLAREELAPGALAFTVAEEGLGNLRGALAACEALRPRAVIALEGHGLDSVLVDAVGSVRARVVVRGPGGHSWADRGRPNPIHALAGVAAALIAEETRETALNIGVVGGGRTVNTIPDEAHMLLEARSLEQPPLDAFAARLAALSLPDPLRLSVEAVARRHAGRLPRDSQLLAAVRGARGELGLPDVLDSGSTDANAALALGIPALALGVARGAEMHTLGERIALDSLPAGRRQLELVVRRLLGAGGGRDGDRRL
jgi:acetylornithine deacetylase/succinyl-diaminopimelate desuccinylase-like protein